MYTGRIPLQKSLPKRTHKKHKASDKEGSEGVRRIRHP